ncbi:MAG: 30S ribosomal protein S16 [Myxococcota bacterium]
MPVTLRLTRRGTKKRPHYRLVAADSRNARDGKFIEILGSYDPSKDAADARLDGEAVRKWLARGATVSPTVQSLLKKHGLLAPAAGDA